MISLIDVVTAYTLPMRQIGLVCFYHLSFLRPCTGSDSDASVSRNRESLGCRKRKSAVSTVDPLETKQPAFPLR